MILLHVYMGILGTEEKCDGEHCTNCDIIKTHGKLADNRNIEIWEFIWTCKYLCCYRLIL